MDVLEQSNIEGFLVTINIQKVFGSFIVNHSFLLAILKAFGFEKAFYIGLKSFISNQDSLERRYN